MVFLFYYWMLFRFQPEKLPGEAKGGLWKKFSVPSNKHSNSTHPYTVYSIQVYMDVSKNRCTPKSSILMGFSIINHPFGGFSPYFSKHPYIKNSCPLLIAMFDCWRVQFVFARKTELQQHHKLLTEWTTNETTRDLIWLITGYVASNSHKAVTLILIDNPRNLQQDPLNGPLNLSI